MKDRGKMENSMEMENMSIKKEIRKVAFGSLENVSNGSMKTELLLIIIIYMFEPIFI